MAYLLTCLQMAAANADEVPPEASTDSHSVWLSPGLYSYHFQREKHLRDNNYGLGLQVALSPSTAVMAGYFRNSTDYGSHYIGWAWQPLKLGATRIGVIATALDGYPEMNHGGWFLGALPVISLEYGPVGVNLSYLPSYQDKIYGALLAQFKLRVW